MVVSSRWHRLTRRVLCSVLLVVTLLACNRSASSADPSFVGVLSLAVDRDVAQRLDISDSVQARLLELIDQRENEALEIVLSIRDLPAAEQTQRLLPFVSESERMGLALLTVKQRERLRQIRLAREGMEALAEPGLAVALGLSEQQRATVQQLLEQRAGDMTQGGENERRVARAIYERKLAGVLDDSQRAAWERVAGYSDAPEAGATQAETAAEPSEQPAEEEPKAPETEPAESQPEPSEGDAEADAEQPGAEPAEADTEMTQEADPDAEAEPATETEPAESEGADAESEAETEMTESDTETAETTTGEEREAGTAPPETSPTESTPVKGVDEPPVGTAEPAPNDGLLRFNFDSAMWKDVLDWFSQQAGLSLAIETVPLGSFTYSDSKGYTVDEALDLMNSYLLTKGFTLVRRERILLVIDLEDEHTVPIELVTLVTIDELDKRGQFELVKCLFPLARMKAEDAAEMIQGYLGPQGAVVPFPKARQILVVETAGKLRDIRKMISRVEDPESGGAETVLVLELKYVSAEEVLAIARPLLGLTEEQTSNEDISLSVDLLGTRIFATGDPDKLQLLRELVPMIDKAPPEPGDDVEEPEQMELRTYFIKSADLQVVLRVVQTLMANLPGIRMDADETSRKLVVLARPSEHETIKSTIDELEGYAMQFEVIPLKRTDPQLAVMAINKFFNLTGGEEGETNTDGPIVDGDPVNMQLWVRGTEEQIAQIKDLVQKLEGPDREEGTGPLVRLLPMTGTEAQSALDTVEKFWNRKNKIRMVTPSNLTPSRIKLRTITPLDEEPEETERQVDPQRPFFPPQPASEGAQPSNGTSTGYQRPAEKSAGQLNRGFTFQFVSQAGPAAPTAETADEAPAAETETGTETKTPAEADDAEPAEIRVAITPGGLLIASEDTRALDAFEEMLRTVSGPTLTQDEREITVFYLKYAKAEIAEQLIQEILSGREDSGGSLLGDMASDLLGGGLIGALAGGFAGGGSEDDAATIQASGVVSIIPDPRLNALIVEANPTDLELIETLLKVIDREDSITEIETEGTPRLIPVIYSSADEVASVIREVFADRITAAKAAGGRQQASPEDLMRALRGQRSNRETSQSRGEEPKMTIGIDTRSNAIIVTAPEKLFKQVETMVHLIDQPGSAEADVVVVVPLRVSDPEVIKKALQSIIETPVTPSSSGGGSGQATPSGGGPSPDQIRQRIEFFRQLQGAGGRPPSGGRPGGGGRSPFGGRGGR